MSCGNPGEVDCNEVLDQVYEYLHHELDEERADSIHQHLEDCGHCLAEYGLEEAVRDLVSRSCRCSQAPEALRTSILVRITEIRS